MKKKIKIFMKDNQTLFALLLTILAGALRLFQLTSSSLWVDELGQVYVSSKDIPSLLSAIQNHLSPPLDYLLLHFTLMLGKSEFIIRINSFLFGTATVLVLFFLIKNMFNLEIASLSSFLLAVSRFHIHYSQEARMYSLFSLLTTISFFLLWKFSNGKNKKHLIGLLVVDLALIYTHYYGIFVIAAQGIYIISDLLFFDTTFKTLKGKVTYISKIMFGFGVVGILYGPWLGTIQKQVEKNFSGNLGGKLGLINFSPENFRLFFMRASWGLWPNFYARENQIFQYVAITFQKISKRIVFSPFEIIFPLLAIVAVILIIIQFRDEYEKLLVLCSWLFVPIILIMFIDVRWETRYFINLLPAYYVLVSLGFIKLNKIMARKVRAEYFYTWIGLSILLIFVPIVTSLYQYYFNYASDDWRNVGKYLQANVNPENQILVLGGKSDYLKYYYNGSADVIDADHMYGDPDIDSIDEFEEYVFSEKCNWLFISQHANLLFTNVYGSLSEDEFIQFRSYTKHNYDLIEDVYKIGGHERAEKELPGLYRKKTCK